ncbi:MAG: TfoX/Sxy family protein [Cellulosilyticaceae bacterium]
MGELAKLPNIGTVVEQQLNDIGITNFKQLEEIGSKKAWLKIKAMDESACIHRLYALEGAIQGISKNQLPVETKKDLKEFYNNSKNKSQFVE